MEAETTLYAHQQKLREHNPHLNRIVVGKPAEKPATTAESAPARKFKWAVAADNLYKFNPDNVVAYPTVGFDIPWETLKGIEKSESGAEGVFFGELTNGVIVIKGSRSLASEAFSSLLSSYFNIYTPAFRIMRTDTPEGWSFLQNVQRVDTTWRATSNLHDLSHMLLQSYIGHGVPLHKLHQTNLSALLEPSAFKDLGAILALDLLVNNGDRLPCPVWDNPGNPGNVLVCDGQIVAIDCQISAIDTAAYPEQFQRYLDQVKVLVERAVSSNPLENVSPFFKLQALLIGSSQVDIGLEGIGYLREGFLSVVSKCKDQKDELISSMAQWKDALSAFKPPLVGLQAVNLEFVNAMVNMVASV